MAFAAVGVATALLYAVWVAWVPLLPDNLYQPLLDLGKITGYTWPSVLRYALLVGGLYAAYLAGYRLVARSAAGAGAVFAFSALFCLELLWAYPATAVDVFGYVAQGRLLAQYGLNPFVIAPDAIPSAPILPYLAFPGEPSQYGPVWVLLGGLLASLAQADLAREVLLYKLVGALAHLAGGGLVVAIAGRLGADRARALASGYLFVWNPLLLWEMVGNAHNDGLMMLGGLGAAWLLAAGYDRFVLPAIALGALVKLPVAALAPVMWLPVWRRHRWAAVESALLAAALLVVFYYPFWRGIETLTPLRRTDLFTASLGSVIVQALEPGYGEAIAKTVARSIALGAFALVYLSLLWQTLRTRAVHRVLNLAYVALLAALLLGNTWFQAWYVVWPFALGAALACGQRHTEVVLLSLGGLVQYLVFIYLWVMGVVPGGTPAIQYLAYAAVVGPLLLGWATRTMVAAGRARRRSAW